MIDRLEHGVRLAMRLGARYAELRHVEDELEQLAVRDRKVDQAMMSVTRGFGVRVIAGDDGGAWGFAAARGDDDAALEKAIRRAVSSAEQIARVHAQLGVAALTLADSPAENGEYSTPVREDPHSIALDEKIAVLDAACAALLDGAGTKATSAIAHYFSRAQRKHLVTSSGARVTQHIVHTGCGMKITVSDGEHVQQRSYPLDLEGGVRAGGFEVVRDFDLLGAAPRIAEEALALLMAPECPATTTTVILDTPQLALQIHESAGHPTEGDRALGDEISLAGGSFLTPARRGSFVYGSPIVHIAADATVPGALGTFGWDDEGVRAGRTSLIEAGRFVGYLSSREVATRLGLGASGGHARADSWNTSPIVRMTNISLAPDDKGPASLEALIADTVDGVLFGNNRSWSIDDLRLDFQFGCEIAWEIKRGRRTRILRNPKYGASTPVFWAGCDAICAPEAFRMWGFTSCGKGDPMQLMAVGHGAAPARFRDVRVGRAE